MIQQLLRTLKNRLQQGTQHSASRIGLLMVAVLCYSVTGFMYFEITLKPELSWWDAIWWSVVTMTTVGYGDLYPESMGGRVFVAIPTMAIGIGLLGFVLSVVATSLIEGRSQARKGLARIRMKNHILICNYPSRTRVREVVEQLRHDASTAKVELVLVNDVLDEVPPELLELDVHFVRGDPARVEVLRRASADTASAALVLAADPRDVRSDHTSLAILLSIETLRHQIHTVAELVSGDNREFYENAGCDSVVCTATLNSRLMVQELLDPGAESVVRQLTSTDYGQQVLLVDVEADTSHDRASTWAQQHGSLLIGYVRDGETVLNESPPDGLMAGDRLVLIGRERPGAFTG